MEPTLIRRIVEAALLASSTPLSVAQLTALFPEDAAAPEGALFEALQALQEDSQQRGVKLVEVASGWRYQVASEVLPWVSRLWAERPPRYSRALLETLALIAYRQPITRGEIEQIRGVAVSTQIVKTLEEREWVRVVGHRDVPGRPALFGTTRGFLDYFGLRSLDELPPLSDLQDLPELEPELPLQPVGGTAAVAESTAMAASNESPATSPTDGEPAPVASIAEDRDDRAEADTAAANIATDDPASLLTAAGDATRDGVKVAADETDGVPGTVVADAVVAAATAETTATETSAEDSATAESASPAATMHDPAIPPLADHPASNEPQAPADAAPEPSRHE